MSFIVDETALHELFDATSGPIADVLDLKAALVLNQMVANCPRDTDQLVESLDMRIVKGQDGIEAHIGVFEANAERDEGTVTNPEVAVYQEFGTSRGVPATNFMSSSLIAAAR